MIFSVCLAWKGKPEPKAGPDILIDFERVSARLMVSTEPARWDVRKRCRVDGFLFSGKGWPPMIGTFDDGLPERLYPGDAVTTQSGGIKIHLPFDPEEFLEVERLAVAMEAMAKEPVRE